MRIERDELASAAAGFSGSFFLLASVSVLRPVRDQASRRASRRCPAPKAFIDSVVYRGGDALAAWLSQALPASALAPAALALCAVWLMNSLALARIGEQRKGRLR